MVTKEAYPELAEKFLSDKDHSPVRAKTDAFYQAQLDLADNIKKMTANGIKINIISGYGLHTGDARYNFFHVTANADNVNGDGVINIESTALGATAALPGESSPREADFLPTVRLTLQRVFFRTIHGISTICTMRMPRIIHLLSILLLL